MSVFGVHFLHAVFAIKIMYLYFRCSVVCYTESPDQLYLGTLIVFMKNFVKRKDVIDLL